MDLRNEVGNTKGGILSEKMNVPNLIPIVVNLRKFFNQTLYKS
jgi:hypothetical protein